MIRVQGNCVSLYRGRWLINIVLVSALLAFVGLFTLPLLVSVIQASQPASVKSEATETLASNSQTKVEEQAKGYELVLQREPDNRTALRGLLEARLQLGNIKGAIEVLEKLAQLNPEQTEYTVLLAQAKQQVGDKEGAATAYRTILNSKPGDMNALQGLVSLLLEQKRPEAAIGLLQDTLKTASQGQSGSIDTTSVQLLLGQIYAVEQRYTEAIAVYDETIKSNKQDFRPVLAKGIVLQKMGKDADAKPLFTTAVSLAPAQYKDQIKQMAVEKSASTSTPSTPSTNPVAPEVPAPAASR